MTFIFGTLCSGIESASEAFLPLGAECRYVSEIEPYPCGVLADRHGAGKPMRMPSPDDAPDLKTRRARIAAIKTIDRFPRRANRIPNYGDLTQIDPEELPAVDLLVAGFPCQDFSIAGLRQSLAGRRGNLTLYGVGLIHELARLRRLRSILLEQVPDILNTKDNAFGALLGGIVGHDAAITSPLKGRRWTNVGVAVGPLGTAAWRVLDAQYAGVAQRRERLFLVASFGNGPDPVEVLFERQGVSRNPPARGETGKGIARPLAAGSQSGGGYRNDADTAENLIPTAFGGNNTAGPIDLATARTASHTASGRQDFETETFVVEPTAYALRGHSDHGEGLPNLRVSGVDAGGGSEALITGTIEASLGRSRGAGTPIPALLPVIYSIMPQNSRSEVREIGGDGSIVGAIAADAGAQQQNYVADTVSMAVRRITCVEAERLQGFRDGYTLIEWPTGNRKGEDLAETISYLIGHGYSPEEAEVLAQTPDGPRYKALGNSKAVPLVRKLGERYAAALNRYLAAGAE